jgi:hypothetical protein
VGFLDPRSEGQAVLKAIEEKAPGRVVVEFLRPATLTKLVERLENRKLPAIDIEFQLLGGYWWGWAGLN